MLDIFKKIISAGIPGIIYDPDTMTETAFWLMLLAAVIICMAAGYLFGSINSAILISTKKYKSDIRTHGSGNAGMTNMFRVYGKSAGILTALGDLLKTAIPVIIGYIVYGNNGAYLAGFFAITGHCFPIYYKFKGGKGVLAAAVMMLLCNPFVFAVELLVFLVVVIGTRMVSMASMMVAFMLPLFIDQFHRLFAPEGQEGTAGIRIPIAVAITALIIFMHRSNIKRILNKEEPKIRLPWDKKKITEDAEESSEYGGSMPKKKNKKKIK